MVEQPLESFAELLRRLRIDAGLTQEQLAEAATVSPRSVSDLERGITQTARRDTARLLANALHLTGAIREEFETAALRRPFATGLFTSALSSVGTVAAATKTLPRDTASFTGRKRELQQLIDSASALAHSNSTVGIYAVGGMAGIGKTALAVHAAHILSPKYPDGQIFLPLHAHTPGQQPVNPTDALASLLQTAGVASQLIPQDLEARIRLWRNHLAGKRMLIVLDDAVSHDQVRPLLPGTGGSLVLITSRRHLTALEDADAVSLDALAATEAAELLIRLAARSDLEPNNQAIAAITRLCGYLPLAIGMLARQLHHHPTWSASDLATDLAEAQDRLERIHAENTSVTAAFDLSYQDLTASQQQAFRRLGMHPGTDIDAYASAALDNTNLNVARRNLEALYDHYLLAEPARGRYRFHDLIAQHARALALNDPPAERDAAIDRLLGYYVFTSHTASHHFARRATMEAPALAVAAPRYVPNLSSQKVAIAWMDSERLNLEAAITYAAANELPDGVIAIPTALHGYMRNQGNLDQVIALHRVALEVARRIGNGDAEANALTNIGDMQYLSGDFSAASETLIQALEKHRSQQDESGEADASSIFGIVQYYRGDHGAATISLDRALNLYRSQDDKLGEANALGYMGYVQLAAGNISAAEASLASAVSLLSGFGDKVREAGALQFLGVVQQVAGDYPVATMNLTSALELFREFGNRLGEATTIRELGIVQDVEGNSQAAIVNLRQALELHRDLRNRYGEARSLHYLGQAQFKAGDRESAISSLTDALALYRDIGNKLGEAEVLNAIGELLLTSGACTEARDCYQQALVITTAIAALLEEARARQGIGLLELKNGQRDRAVVELRHALAIFQSIGSPRAKEVLSAIESSAAS